MSIRYDIPDHNQLEGEHSHAHRHHHCVGKSRDNRGLYPARFYTDEALVNETTCLEVSDCLGFMHVCCPSPPACPCPSCGRPSLHLDSLVVAVDGACPGNGTRLAIKSAYSVYFGPDMPENFFSMVPDIRGYRHTNQRAVLHAAIAAVKASRTFIYHGGQWVCEGCPEPCRVTYLVIKSDSAYLVNGITDHVNNWLKDGWSKANGAVVKNIDLWNELLSLVTGFHKDTGVVIDFWHIPREQNIDAKSLASQGVSSKLSAF